MCTLAQLLGNVYENAYVSKMKKPFSEPKIYTGGIDTSKWSALSENEKQKALAKRWYVYFSYRHPETIFNKFQFDLLS